MTPLNAFLLTVAIVVAAKTFAWLVQLRTRNGGLVDSVWAVTLGGLAVFYAWSGDAPLIVRIVVALMGGIWGLRLGVHLFIRNWGKAEDWRYAGFRHKWGARADWNMFWFFQFQNLFTLMLSASAFLPLVYRDGVPPFACLVLALLIFLASIVGEGIADAQMERFRSNPDNRGQVCRAGLWRWSRHPNYFFECLHWVAYVPLAWGMDLWWLTLGAPLVMAFLLMKMSGVPLMEKEMMQRKPGYAEYVRTTSALIPWPPRKAGVGR